jgi:hypothetical protein
MKMALEIGAELDIPTQDEIRHIMRNELGRARNVSVVRKLRGSGVMPSTGVLVVDLGYPESGTLWDLRSIWVSGNDPSTAVANTKALVGIGTLPVTGMTIAGGLLDPSLFYATLAPPAAATWSKDEATIHAMEHLFVVFVGAANTTALNVGAQVVRASQKVAEGYEW